MTQEESQNLEYKTSLDYKAIAKAVVAFANSQGGRIKVGVNDNDKVVGIDIGKTTLERVANEIARKTDPSIYPIILEKQKNSKTYIEIIVEKSFISPHFADHVAYKRVGRTSQKLTAQEIEKIISQKNTVSFDNTVLTQAKINHISMKKVRKFLNSVGKNYQSSDYLLSRNCLRQQDNGVLTPTVAGVLLFGANPQSFLVQSHITLVDYTQTQPLETKSIKSIAGTLLEQLDQLIEIIYRAYPPLDVLHQDEIRRKKIYVIPPAILREILVNALIHRDYTDYGRKITIQLYKNKIIVSNPAKFDKNITPTDLSNYQYSQNPILTRVFFEAGLIEEIGEGVDKILEWTHKTGLQIEKAYNFNHNQLQATVYLNKPELLISKNYQLNNRQKKMIKKMSDSQGYSSSELAKFLDVSKDTVLSDLSTLDKIINVVEEGQGRTTRYRWIH